MPMTTRSSSPSTTPTGSCTSSRRPADRPDDPARMIGNGAVDAPNVAPRRTRHAATCSCCAAMACTSTRTRRDIGRLLRGPGAACRGGACASSSLHDRAAATTTRRCSSSIVRAAASDVSRARIAAALPGRDRCGRGVVAPRARPARQRQRCPCRPAIPSLRRECNHDPEQIERVFGRERLAHGHRGARRGIPGGGCAG